MRIENTPDDAIYDDATDAYFAGHITVDEFFAYREAYGPDWENMFKELAKIRREHEISQMPRFKRWLARLLLI